MSMHADDFFYLCARIIAMVRTEIRRDADAQCRGNACSAWCFEAGTVKIKTAIRSEDRGLWRKSLGELR